MLAMVACTTRITDFTVLSTKNFDMARMDEMKRSGSRISGKDEVWWILVIPTGVLNVKEAIDNAIESVPGCVALLDGVLYHKEWWALLVGKQAYVVEGTPLIDPKIVAELPSNYIVTEYDDAAGKFVSRFVDRAEFEKYSNAAKDGSVVERL